MKIPIVCENDKCSNSWRIVNVVSEIDEDSLDAFYEGYSESEPEDHCSICGELGVAEDPWPDSIEVAVGDIYA